MQVIFSRTILAALALVASSFSMSANAQEFKIGFINTDRIFRDANSAKAAQAKLEQEFSRREKELNDLGLQIKAAADKLDKDAPTLSESQKTTRQKQPQKIAFGATSKINRSTKRHPAKTNII